MEKYICGDILKESEYLLNTIKTSKNMEGIENVIGIEIWDENNKCYHIVKRDWIYYRIYFIPMKI